jgi:hypothetical protein
MLAKTGNGPSSLTKSELDCHRTTAIGTSGEEAGVVLVSGAIRSEAT